MDRRFGRQRRPEDRANAALRSQGKTGHIRSMGYLRNAIVTNALLTVGLLFFCAPAVADDFYAPFEPGQESTSVDTSLMELSVITELQASYQESSEAPHTIKVEDLRLPTDLEELIQYLSQGYVQPDTELTLEDAICIALIENHALNSKRLESAAASKGVKVAHTDLNPQLGMQAKAYYNETNVSSTGSPMTNVNDLQRSLAFSLTQRIYDFGITHDLIDIAAAQHEMAKFSMDMEEQRLVQDVIDAYYTFNLALGQARVRDDEVKLAKEFLRQANIQYEVGVVPKLDVIRAEARVEQARAGYIAAQAQVGNAAALFFSKLGVEDKRYIPALVTAPMAEVGPPPPDISDAITDAFEFRPELMMQYSALGLYEAQRDLTSNRPVVDAYANALYSIPGSMFSGTDAYEYGVQLNWQLYNGGKDKESREQAKLNIAAISEGVLDLKAQLELEVTTSWNRVYASRSSADAAKKTLDLSSEALRAASVGYSAGVTPYIEYQDALDQNVAAAIGYLVALAEVKQAQINLTRATGFPNGYPGDNRAGMNRDITVGELLGIEDPTGQ